MRSNTLGLAWISVKDLKQAVKFYTESVGLKLMEMNEEWGWAELEGHDGGARLGLAQYVEKGTCDMDSPIKPGENAILSFTVDNIEKAREEMELKGVKLIGSVVDIPGHVKMQLLQDNDGNFMHIVECINADDSDHCHSGGCCC